MKCEQCNNRAGHYHRFIYPINPVKHEYQALCAKCERKYEGIYGNPYWIRQKITKTQYLAAITESQL